MFRVLLLGVNDQLSDRQLPFQLLDRRSFKRFVGLRNESTVPDQKTIWKYRHRLAASGRTKAAVRGVRGAVAGSRVCADGRPDRGLDDGGNSPPTQHSRGERSPEAR